MEIETLGDSAVLLRLGEAADERTARAVGRMMAALEGELAFFRDVDPLLGSIHSAQHAQSGPCPTGHSTRLVGGTITDLVASYTTIGIYFEPAKLFMLEVESPVAAVMEWVRSCAAKVGTASGGSGREMVIPVCFGGGMGPDLAGVARAAGMTEAEVVTKYCAARYEVRAIGFVPGFGYLAGLPAALHTRRRGTPRTRVPAGSVGIGGGQTGVYPLETPGGWNVIGRTATKMFSEAGSLLRVGDGVRFVAVAELGGGT